MTHGDVEGRSGSMLKEIGVGIEGDCGSAPVTIPSSHTRQSAESRAVDGSVRFAEHLAEHDVAARRSGRTVPTQDELRGAIRGFWQLVDLLASCRSAGPAADQAKVDVREVLHPWFLRSRYWSWSLVKPHGVSGDFRMSEWIFDLQGNPCLDPTQPSVVNLLDLLFAEVQRESEIWHRRSWVADQIVAASGQLGRPARVLDVASAGSRSVRDALESRPGSVRLAVLDEDPAAIAFVRSWLPAGARDPAGLHSTTLDRMREVIPRPAWPEGGFDLVISTDGGDALEDEAAATVVDHLVDLTRPGGSTLLCAFSPATRSRVALEWICDWTRIHRGEDALRELFPVERRHTVRVTTSPHGNVLCATARKR
jgi:hypothetical protein